MVSDYYDIRGGVKNNANAPQYYRIRAMPTCCFSPFGQSAVGLYSVRSVVVISLNESVHGMKILYFRTFVRNVCVITSPQERVTLYIRSLIHLFCSRLRSKCDCTRAETIFRLSAKRTSLFKSAGASVQSTTVSRGVHISGCNAGYTMFRGSVKSTGYPLHSPVSPSVPLPCVTVCHHVSTGFYQLMRLC
jgi:hypothetical protein